MKENEKTQKFIIIGIVCAAILLISFIAYSLNSRSNSGSQDETKIGSESASTQIGKSTEEAKNELSKEDEFETAKLVEKQDEASTEKQEETEDSKKDNAPVAVKPAEKQENKEEKKQTSNTEVIFTSPVKGSILREFARESLVYSNTLKEWITHNGVDIKADKTTVVGSAADGTIYAVKNDPRYGLTVIINHDNGYQTIYSNLLTAEFVVEGEKVTSGQSIGTVGNTASFEVLDDYHLHFELLQNGEYLDPTIYMTFE